MTNEDMGFERSKWKLKYADVWDEKLLQAGHEVGDGWIAARIPSNVQEFFAEGDPFHARNLEKLLWTEEKVWVYAAEFDTEVVEGKRYFLRFRGVDYFTRIYLNGRLVTEHEGMYSDIVPEVSAELRNGSNRLHVVLWLPAELRDRAVMDRVLKCHSQYGWDFAPRLLTMGIWDEVLLEERESLWLDELQVRTRVLGGQAAVVEVEGHIAGGDPEASRVEVVFDGISYPAVAASGTYMLQIPVSNPKLWYPAGYGEVFLYDMTVSLSDKTGRCQDSKKLKVGIRQISAIHCPEQKKQDMPLKFVINGREIYLKGANWVPADVFPARLDRERYRQLLTLLRGANCNIVRVWGGGLVEKEAFYELCDELGILVFQEFPMACFVPRRDDAFLALLEQEGTAMVKKLRNHPSILLWCGGNELYVDWSPVREGGELAERLTEKVRNIVPGFNEETFYAGADRYNEPALRLLEQICKTHDNTRPYHISSPLEGEGEVHGPWTYDLTIGDERYQMHENFYTFWNQFDRVLYSEVGCNGAAGADAWRRMLPPEEQWPLNPDGESLTYHKGFGAAWTKDTWLTAGIVEKLFGKIDSLEDFLWASQYIQAEGLRYLLQEVRRKGEQKSGVLLWCFNEPWPNAASSTFIGYYGEPKLAYEYVKRAFSPVQASLRYNSLFLEGRLDAELWYCSHEPALVPHTVRIELRNGEGTVLHEKVINNVKPGKLQDVSVIIKEKGLIIVQVEVTGGGASLYRDRYAFVNGEMSLRGFLVHKNEIV